MEGGSRIQSGDGFGVAADAGRAFWRERAAGDGLGAVTVRTASQRAPPTYPNSAPALTLRQIHSLVLRKEH